MVPVLPRLIEVKLAPPLPSTARFAVPVSGPVTVSEPAPGLIVVALASATAPAAVKEPSPVT